MKDPSAFSSIVTLDDGTRVTLRAVRRDDGPKICRAFHRLVPETIHARFFGQRTEVSDAELRHITHVDFRRDAALLVTIGSGDAEAVIGGVSYFALDDGAQPPAAELAFTVAEGYQGRGIGRLLMQHIIEIARANGVAFLEADLLADNHLMLAVFQHSGLPLALRQERDLVHVRMEVGKTNPS